MIRVMCTLSCLLLMSGCASISEALQGLPEISYTDQDQNTVGRGCKVLESGNTECTVTIPGEGTTITTYDSEGLVIGIKVIAEPRK